MNRETLELLVFVGMCFAASYLLMREFRAYLDAVFSRSPASRGPMSGNAPMPSTT